MRNDSNHAALHRRYNRCRDKMNALACEIKRQEQRMQDAVKQLERLRADNPDFVHEDMRAIVWYRFGLIILPVLWGVDYLLLNPVLEYLLAMNFATPLVLYLGRALLPAAIISIELLLANWRLRAYDEASEEKDDRGLWIKYRFMLVLSVLLMLVVPAGVVAFFYVIEGLPHGSRYALLFVAVVLSLIGHGLVTFCGHEVREALAFHAFRFRQLRLERARRRAEEWIQFSIPPLQDAWERYELTRRMLPSSDHMDALDPVTRRVLQRYEILLLSGVSAAEVIDVSPSGMPQ